MYVKERRNKYKRSTNTHSQENNDNNKRYIVPEKGGYVTCGQLRHLHDNFHRHM